MKRILVILSLVLAFSLKAGAQNNGFEQEFVNWYYSVLDMPSRADQISMITNQYAAFAAPPAPGSPDLYQAFIDACEKYMYDPNSPLRDEDLWGVVASLRADDPLTPANQRAKYREDARLCALNPVGSRAVDFKYEDSMGGRHRLYDITASYVILMFSNPGCPACRSIIDAICAESSVDQRVRSGAIAVLNVYVDEDLDSWRSYLKEYPKYWHNGFDPTFSLKDDNVYHIRAIPSLYLLGKDKTVIFKDVDTEVMLNYLVNN